MKNGLGNLSMTSDGEWRTDVLDYNPFIRARLTAPEDYGEFVPNESPVFLPAFDELEDCLHMVELMMSQIKVNETILNDSRYDYMFSVEEVNRLTLEGTPFRDAYKQVGLRIEAGDFTPDKNLHHTHEGSIGNLCNDRIAALMQQTMEGFHFERMEQAEKTLLGR